MTLTESFPSRRRSDHEIKLCRTSFYMCARLRRCDTVRTTPPNSFFLLVDRCASSSLTIQYSQAAQVSQRPHTHTQCSEGVNVSRFSPPGWTPTLWPWTVLQGRKEPGGADECVSTSLVPKRVSTSLPSRARAQPPVRWLARHRAESICA
jgi:hypothetical protein